MRQWQIEVDGTKHEIKYKQGIFKRSIIVDGEVYKVKSSSSFINIIDYGITFGNTECKLVVIGNKVDLAVNGTFLGSKKAYEPLSGIPAFVWVFIGISVIGGRILSGILGLLAGISMSLLYIQFAVNKNIRAVIASFIGCTVLQIIIAYGLYSFFYNFH